MPKLYLTKDREGRLCGLTEIDQNRYVKFLDRALSLPQDESISFTWTNPRSPKYHKRHFVMVNALFAAQEAFDNSEGFRKFGEVGAGYADMVPGIVGYEDGDHKRPIHGMVALPKSISYESLDQDEFSVIHKDVFEFYRSEAALRCMFPHLSYDRAWETVDAALREFDNPMGGRRTG